MKHIYFAQTIERKPNWEREKLVYWLVKALNIKEALKILGAEVGFITELTPEVEFTREPKWEKVKLHEERY